MRFTLAPGQNTAPNLTPDQLRADIRDIAPRSDAIVWTEFGEDRDHDVLRDTLGPDWHTVGRSECPVSLRRSKLTVVDHRTIRLSEPIPGVNPWRPAEIVTVEHATRPRLEPFAIVGTHWTNGSRSNPGQRAEDERDDRWADCWAGTRTVILELAAARTSTFFAGDLNARDVQKFTRTQDWLPGTDGIDKAAVIEVPDGTRFHVPPTPPQRLRVHSKHDALTWKIRLSR